MQEPKRPVRDRLAHDTANFVDQEQGATKTTEPKTNVFGSAWLAVMEYLNGRENPFPRWGHVVDFVPMHNAYRVQAEHGGIFTCTFGSTTGHQPSGSRQGNTLPLGTNVIFIPPVQSHYGVILCSDPGYITDGRNFRSDFIVQGGNTGLYSEDAHDALLTRLQYQGGNPCFNGGRPFDSTSAGETHFSAETGLAFHQDPFLAYMRVDEETGLFLFYHDQYARLSGHNLDFRSVLGDREELDDQQEAIMMMGQNPYPWERYGAWDWCDLNYTERDADIVQHYYQEYSLLEPKYEDQQPFNRVSEYAGYLGQGRKHLISLPPYPDQDDVNRYSTTSKYIGVLNIQEALDGSYAIESAKRIVLAKRVPIPVPKLMIRPEDERGDNETNYKAAGKFGAAGTEEHKLASQFNGATGPPELVRASSILDLSAFTFNWQSLHPFFYHRRDWYLPEECELALNVAQLPISFCFLQNQQLLSAPSPRVMKIDHRTLEAEFYPNETIVAMLEDGGFVIRDGFGTEYKSTMGSLDISSPGDINLRPGKNLNIWAGWDAVIRANNSADITATIGDVRLKGEHLVQILGGNDTKGGVLIEGRGECAAYDFTQVGQKAQHSGVMLVSKKAPVVAYGSDIFLQTEAGAPGTGNVVITAGRNAEKDLKVYCNNFISYLNKSRADHFGSVINEYWAEHALFGAALRVKGKTILNSNLVVGDWITVVNGHIATTEAEAYMGLVAKPSDISIPVAELSYISTRHDYVLTVLNNNKNPVYETNIKAQIVKAEASLRTVADYRTTGYVFFETAWQQLARMTNNIPAFWTEKKVTTAVDDTYPHPGKEILTGSTWYTQDLTLYNPQEGGSIDRASNKGAYEDPKFGATKTSTLNGIYPIIRNC